MGNTFVVERAKSIAAPPEEIFARIVDLQQWEGWSPWAKMDPEMQTTYEGEAGAVGSSYHWVGNRKVGEGRMTIKEVDSPNRVAIDLHFLKPFKAENVTELTVKRSGEGSEVVWSMTGEHSWMTKIMGIFRSMDKMVGPDFEKGLTSLKGLSEA